MLLDNPLALNTSSKEKTINKNVQKMTNVNNKPSIL